MSLEKLSAMSNKYVLGRGNISFKDDDHLWIKDLGTISTEEIVKMDRKSVENDCPDAVLHNIFAFSYVCHTHCAVINGLTCSKGGRDLAFKLLGDEIIWIDNEETGRSLSEKVEDAMTEFKAKNGKDAQVILLQNHGIFVAGNSTEEIDALYDKIVLALKKDAPDFSAVEFDTDKAVMLAPAIRMLALPVVTFACNKTIACFVESKEAFEAVSSAFTFEQIVYCNAEPLFIEKSDDIEKQYEILVSAINTYKDTYGCNPKIIAVEGLGVFAAGVSKEDADTAMRLFTDAMKIALYAKSFGGHSFIKSNESCICRENACSAKKRAQEKIVIVTGSAQGFGQGVAEELLKEGANVVVADMNGELAAKNAEEYCKIYGAGKAFAATVNVSDEESVKAMVDATVLTYGGIDTLVNNAGIVRAGSLEEMTLQNFDLVTKVNYHAYFLCVKYVTNIMKIQNRFNPEYFMDVIQINSKSGLSGSNKNFAYAGSKFGGIGLTQSFALELCPFNIKVNSVCPGNFLDGPLWCDPEKGLFRQYLEAGKVPGAKTIEDVKRFYESKVPMNRGCHIIDVARAIFYCMEQNYETGQAIPVTGGQEMLK